MLDFIVGFAVSVLSGLGIGGGGLLVIYLSLMGSAGHLAAQGINLLFFICASGAAFLMNLKKRRFDLRRMAILSASGVAFAVLGAMVAGVIDAASLKKMFGGFLALSGIVSFFGKE